MRVRRAGGTTIEPIVGREAELSELATFVERVPDGPAALLLAGEPGIGKTTIWRHGVDLAAGRSYRVLVSRPAEAESQLPFAGLGDLLGRVADAELAGLPPAQRRAIEVALLREASEGPPLEQRAVAVGLLGILGRLAAQGPVVIAIDDAQWLDPASTRVLEFACRRLESRAIGLLISIRGRRRVSDPYGLRRALPEGRVVALHVGPLSERELDRLLRGRLNLTVPTATLRRLHDTSGGNPFFALEIGRALAAQGQFDDLGGLPVPETLRELVLERLYRLPGTARDVLLAVAAASHPTLSLVTAVAANPARAKAAIERAVAAGAVEVDGQSIRFSHPLLGSLLYGEVSRDAKRDLHGRLASIVTDPDERALHLALAASGPDEAVAAALDIAAQRARSRGAPDAAAALAERARQLTPADHPSEAARRAIEAGLGHLEAGDAPAAARILEPLVGSAQPGAELARALLALGRVRMFDRGLRSARPLLERAAEAAGDDPSLQASIWRDLGIAIAQSGHLDDALVATAQALDWAEKAREDPLIAEALVHRASVEFLLGRGIRTDLLERAARIEAERTRSRSEWAVPFVPVDLVWGAVLKWSDQFDAARERLAAVRRQSTQSGDETPWVSLLLQSGELELWAGNWTLAAQLADEAQELSERRDPAMRQDSAYLAAAVEAHRGESAARATAREAVAQAERTGDLRFLIRSHALLGFIELSDGRPADALPHLELAHELFRGAGYGDPGVIRFVPDLIETLAASNRPGRATDLEGWLSERGAELDRPYALATAARCRGILLSAAGDPAGALNAMDVALAHHRRLPQPFELGRTQLVRGGVLRRSRAKREARAALAEAAATFEALGAAPWLRRARAELGRIGGRAPSAGGLTPTESQVAALAAQGFGNQEIADALFVSPKTVETHLTRVYEKLGVRSRGELVRRSRSGELPDFGDGQRP